MTSKGWDHRPLMTTSPMRAWTGCPPRSATTGPADARALKAYARAAPVTRASAKSLTVMHRKVKSQRLASVGYLWSFAALTASPGGRAQSTKAPDLEANSAAKSSAGVRSLFRIERDGGDIQAVDTQKRSVPSSSFSNTPPFR